VRIEKYGRAYMFQTDEAKCVFSVREKSKAKPGKSPQTVLDSIIKE